MIQVSDVVKSFDGHTALDGVDLSIAPASVTALLGANGAGKSTTLLTLAGLVFLFRPPLDRRSPLT